MITFDTAALPMPSTVDRRDATAILRSSAWRQGGRFTSHVPDPANRVWQWSLAYMRAPARVLHVLREHYRTWQHASFEWTPPGSSTVFRVIYLEPTVIDWTTPVSGTARVFLEEALAH